MHFFGSKIFFAVSLEASFFFETWDEGSCFLVFFLFGIYVLFFGVARFFCVEFFGLFFLRLFFVTSVFI